MFNVRHFAARAGKRPLCPVLLATIASLRVLRLNMSTSHTLQPASTLHNMWIDVCAGSSLLITERLWPRWAIQSSWPAHLKPIGRSSRCPCRSWCPLRREERPRSRY